MKKLQLLLIVVFLTSLFFSMGSFIWLPQEINPNNFQAKTGFQDYSCTYNFEYSDDFIGPVEPFWYSGKDPKEKIIKDLLKEKKGNITSEDLRQRLAMYAPPPPGGNGCADIQALDLRGVPNFAQTDDLAKCGQPDTLAFLIFTDEPGSISSMQMTVKMESGMEYADFETTHYGGSTTITNINSSANNPKFLLNGITGADEIFVAYIGVKATCGVDIENITYNVSLDFNYVYTDTLGNIFNCSFSKDISEEYNNSFSEPVLNIRSLSPADATVSSIGNPYCQTIQISQDGLSTYLDSLDFHLYGIVDGGDVILSSISVNGMPAAYTYSASDTTYNVPINSSFFSGNGNPNPSDDKFNTDETLNVQVCYSIGDCPQSQIDFPIVYSTSYGCSGSTCQTTQKDSYVLLRPTGAAMPTATVEMISGASICGAPGQFDLTITNPNANTNQFMMTNVSVGFNTCEKSNLGISDITIGGTSLDPAFYTWDGPDIWINFDSLAFDPDGAEGLMDFDGDGFFDDLPGGETITLTVYLEMECGTQSQGGGCPTIDCGFTQFFVEGEINCGQSFKTFPPVTGGSLKYAPTDDHTNMEEDPANKVGNTPMYNFGNYDDGVHYGPKTREVEYCYTFDSENVTPCASTPDVYFQLSFVGDPLVALDIEYVPGTAEFNDGTGYVAVNDTDVDVTQVSPSEKLIQINAGSPDSGVEICYKLTVEMDSAICAPRQYWVGNFKVIEECPDCNGGCQIVKACRGEQFSGDPYNTGCLCMFEQVERSFTRKNLGYTDKSLTTKVSRDTILANNPADLIHFMPCDTMLGEEKWVIHDMDFFLQTAWWSFGYSFYGAPNTDLSRNLMELTPDARNSKLIEISVIKNGTTTHIPVDFTAIASCVSDGSNTVYYRRPIQHYFGDAPMLGDENQAYKPGLSNNSGNTGECIIYDSYDGRDNKHMGFTIYNKDYWDCRNQTSEAPGNCLDDFLTQYNIEVNDTFYFKWEVPIIKNPALEARLRQEADGTLPPGFPTPVTPEHNIRIYPSTNTYSINPYVSYCYGYNQGSCGQKPLVQTTVPGDITVKSELDIDDCGGSARHIYTFDGVVPNDWFTEEYRPLMGINKTTVPVFSPGAYCGNAKIYTITGDTIMVQPDTVYNGECAEVNGDNVCAISSGDHENIVFDIQGLGISPFVVGKGLVQDSLMLTYDICMLCPDVAPITNYRVTTEYQYLCGEPSSCKYWAYTWQNFNTGNPTVDNHPEYYMWVDASGDPVSGNWYEHFIGDTLQVKRDTSIDVTISDNRLGRTGLTANNVSGTNLLASDVPGTSVEWVEMEVCAEPPSPAGGLAGVTNLQASIRLPSSVKLVDVVDASDTHIDYTLIGTDTIGYSTYSVQLPDLNEGDCTTIKVGTTLLFCPEAPAPPPEICTNFSSGCAPSEYADAIATLSGLGEPCQGVSICYAYVFGEADLQTEWFLPDPLDPYPQLCDEVEFAYRVKNVKPMTLVNLVTMIDIPEGLTVSPGSWELAYPGNNTLDWQSIPDPDIINGNHYEYSDDAIWCSDINANGFKGVGAGLDSNFFAIKFRATTNCNEFLSGSIMHTETTATDPCGPESLSTGNVQSPPIIVQTARPADFAQLLTYASPENSYCGALVNQFGITALNISTNSTTDSVTVCLLIPPELTYQSGSVGFTSPDYTPNNIVETVIGDDLQVCFDAPRLDPGGMFTFTFDAVQDPAIECGPIEIGVDIKSYKSDCMCSATGLPCGVFIQNSINPTLNVELGPPLETTDIRLLSSCGETADTVNLCYEVDLHNPGPDYSGNIHIGLYKDINGNGAWDSFDPEMTGYDHAVSVLSGDTVTVTMCSNIAKDDACPIIVGQTYETACGCDQAEKLINEVEPSFFADLPDEKTLCPGDDYSFAICDGFDPSALSLTPADAGTISIAGTTATVSLNAGAGDPGPVKLSLEYGVGGCSKTFSMNLYQPTSIEMGPYDAVLVCETGCNILSLNLGPDLTGQVNVQWTPSVYLDDPTAENVIICDPGSNTNYNVSITLPDGCGTSATYPVIIDPIHTISTSVGDCYYENTQSLVDVAVTLSWNEPLPSDVIQVAIGDSIGIIDPHTASKPATVTVTVPAKDTIVDVLINYQNNPSCQDVTQVQLPDICAPYDWGDLPSDLYATSEADNGPRHLVTNGLMLGSTIDDESNGQPNNTATGDGNDEDGLGLTSNLNWKPNNTIRIPLTVTNTTGQTAHFEAWIDWNGDGDFDDPGEMVADLDDSSGSFPEYITVTVPGNVALDQPLGFRNRLSLQDDMTPYGQVESGEVEDYLITVTCGTTPCLPIISNKN